MELDYAFAKRLEKRRTELGYTQKSLGAEINQHQSRISELENIKSGETKTCTFLPELAWALEWTVEEMLDKNNPKALVKMSALKFQAEIEKTADLLKEASKRLSKLKKELNSQDAD